MLDQRLKYEKKTLNINLLSVYFERKKKIIALFDMTGLIYNITRSFLTTWWARAKSWSDQDQLQEALSDLREALKLAPQNLQLHAFSLQVKNQLERKQAKMFQKATTEMSSKMISKEDEDEIKSLEVTTLVIEN